MALTVEAIMNGIYSNPDVAAIGAAAGFLFKTALDWKKRRKRGMGGMGGFP